MRTSRITILSVCLMLLLWQMIAIGVDKPALIPTLPGLLETLFELVSSTGFYLSVGATVGRGMLGMTLSLLAAIILSYFFAKAAWLYELFRPMLSVMRSVPVISFILLALIFLHTESIPLLIGFLTMFPLLTENLTKGICSFRPGLSVMGKLFLVGRRNKLTLIIYPQIKPFLYSGLASAAGFGWRAIIMGEVLSLCTFGIGSEMKRAESFIAVPELICWTLVAISIGYLSDKGIGWLSGRKFAIRYAVLHPTAGVIFPEEKKPVSATGITLSHVSYIYGVTDYSFFFQPNRIYGISAPSGTGKTTLLNLINGTLQPTQGDLAIDRSQGIAFVFQDMELLPNLTVIENVMLPLARTHTKAQASVLAQPVLEAVGLASLVDRYPTELSYGQQQRVAIARALLFPSPYLLMDEPFKGIDEGVSLRILQYMRRRQEQTNQTILFTTHHPEELRQLADEVIYLC